MQYDRATYSHFITCYVSTTSLQVDTYYPVGVYVYVKSERIVTLSDMWHTSNRATGPFPLQLSVTTTKNAFNQNPLTQSGPSFGNRNMTEKSNMPNENQIWRVKTNEELDKLIKHKNIINYIKAQRLNWFGHVQRMPDTRTVK